jgi:hypothetical protein
VTLRWFAHMPCNARPLAKSARVPGLRDCHQGRTRQIKSEIKPGSLFTKPQTELCVIIARQAFGDAFGSIGPAAMLLHKR